MYPPGGLGELLRGRHGVVRVGHAHRQLVAARLLEEALQLADGSLHGAAGAEVHFTDHDEDGNFQRHGQAQVLPGGAGWTEESGNTVSMLALKIKHFITQKPPGGYQERITHFFSIY